MKPLRIALTGLNAADNPGPGMAVIRCLHETGSHRYVGLAYDALETAIHDPGLLHEVYLVPYPSEGERAALARLQEIHRRSPFSVLIPTLDSELVNYARLARDLSEMGVATLLPTLERLQLRSKLHLAEFCARHSFRVPPTRVASSVEEVVKAGADFGWPVVVKGTFHGAHLASNPGDARVWFEHVRRRWGLPVVVQGHLSGEEYDVAAVGSRAGVPLGMVAMRKLRITEKGTAWAGITVRHEPLLELARRLMAALSWAGPVEFEFLLDQASGEFHLLEINPRFPSWIYLSAGAGLNLPCLALEELLGLDPEPRTDYRAGCTFVRHALDLVCPLGHLESLTTKGELIFDDADLVEQRVR